MTLIVSEQDMVIYIRKGPQYVRKSEPEGKFLRVRQRKCLTSCQALVSQSNEETCACNGGLRWYPKR